MASPAQVPVLEQFDEWVRRAPQKPLMHYFGRDISFIEADQYSRSFAEMLQRKLGVSAGDRVVLILQNTPAFVLSILACWRIGAIAVPSNPMYKERELTHIFRDSGARVAIAHPQSADLIRTLYESLPDLTHVVVSDESDFAAERCALWPDNGSRRDDITLLDCIEGYRSQTAHTAAGEIALISYTSGTTGRAKGAVNTHANLGFQARSCRDWFELTDSDKILTLAPLFHITGIGTNLVVALGAGLPLVLTYRFDAKVVCELIEHYRPTFAIGSITTFIALLGQAQSAGRDLSSLKTAFSGGAPVPPSVVRQYEAHTGIYIHNAYGMTESASATIMTPFGARAPVDEISGALSIGVPIAETRISIVDDDGDPVRTGEIGELIVSGPQVAKGYWRDAAASAATFANGALRTGDVAFADADGWIYLVDRKKDLINAGGYKIWPREVEDVLYEHASVREAGVVGEPDAYLGETVVAYVSLKVGLDVAPNELIAHCRERLAAFKCPRRVEIVHDLPKTISGKIMRRELRQNATS